MGGNKTTTTTGGTQKIKIPKEVRQRGSQITTGAMDHYFDPANKYQDFTNNAQDQSLGRARTAQLNPYHNQAGQQAQGAQQGWQPYYNQGAQQAGQARQQGYTQGPNYTSQNIQQFMNPYQQNVIDTGVQEIGRNLQLQRLDNQSRAAGAGAFGGARHGVVDAESQRNAGYTLQNFLGNQLNQGFNQAVGQYNTDFGQRMAANQQNYGQGMGYANFLQGQGTNTQQRYLDAQKSANQQGNIVMAQDQAQRDNALASRDQRMNYPMDVYERLAALNAGQPVNRTSTTTGTSTSNQSGGWLGSAINAAGTIGGAAFGAGGIFASDENLKEDIEDVEAEEVLGAFSQVKPKTYTYKQDAQESYPGLTRPGRRTGFMAQDVERAFGRTNPSYDGFQMIDTSEMIGNLVAAVHGLEKRTRDLRPKRARG